MTPKSTRRISLPTVLVAMFGLLCGQFAAHADITYTNLVSFDGTNGAYFLWGSSLAIGPDGNFYGTTEGQVFGPGPGTVFQMTPSGSLSNIVYFPQSNPISGDVDFTSVTPGKGGIFYFGSEVAYSNNNIVGYGKLFSFKLDGTLTTLVSFNTTNGYSPTGVIPGVDGNLYGVTQSGGGSNEGPSNPGYGTVFRMTTNGTLTTLVAFDGIHAAGPCTPLVQTKDGSLYGMANQESNLYFGTIFRVSSNGVFTNLVSFNGTNGEQPAAGLTLGLDGFLYGTTMNGGTNGYGNFFRVSTNGTFTNLYTFNPSGASAPDTGLLQASDGNFYGSTYVGSNAPNGTIYRITPQGNMTVLYTFPGSSSGFGTGPSSGLVQGSDGCFYGEALQGGTYGLGAIYRLTVPGADSPYVQMNVQSTNISLSWIPLPLRSYQIQSSSDLHSTNWANVGSAFVPTNSPITVSVGATTNTAAFYRVVLLP